VASAVTIAVGLAAPARANLILLGPATGLSGQGIGNVATILNLQSQGSTTVEAGRIIRSGGSDLVQTDPATQTQTPGGRNNTTRTFSELGITSNASEFRLLLNINESDNILTLESLQVTFYNGTTGAAFFTAALAGPALPLTEQGSGIGNSDYVFGLDATQAQ